MEAGNNKTDIAVSISKGIAGALPFIGPMIAEVIGTLIPSQRIDRLEAFLKVLDEKVEHLGRDRVREAFADPQFVDLLEDGMYQAARALSHERLEYIASLLKNSITDEELEHLEAKKLLSLLGEMNDAEVVILRAYAFHHELDPDPEFRKRHENVLQIRATHADSTRREMDEETIYNSFRNGLVNMGLIQPRYKRPRKGELPEFDDKTGRIKAQGYDITRSGRLLLRQIDMIE